MEKFQTNIITSDITYMKNTYCVAGWDTYARCMRRLMIKGNHWSEEDLNKIKGYSSIIVNIVPSEKSRDYPHKTEDCWINEDIQLRHSYDDLSSLAKDLQSNVSKTIASIFNWKIKKKNTCQLKQNVPH